jgi:Ca2+-binding RTX toxin-like protein
MHRLHQHPIRSSVLAATVLMVMGLLGGAAAAQAAIPCVVGPGVTQTDTTVTGSNGNDTIACGGTNPGKTINGLGGNDTITGTDFADTINGGDGNDTLTGGTGDDALNGGLGGDTISGSAGNDTLIGASNDGIQDSLDGGLGTDACQGPAPDPDIHANCEITTMPPVTGPGSSRANATELCRASGGTFVDLGPLAYNCLFLGFSGHRLAEAGLICTERRGAFLATLVSYSCLLPS